MKISFDLRNNFTNYEGQALLSHYHEAAYDAYMTGICFANILKFKENDKGKPPKTAKKATPGKDGKDGKDGKEAKDAKETKDGKDVKEAKEEEKKEEDTKATPV